MSKIFKLDSDNYSINNLEKELGFKFLKKNVFETKEEEQKVKEKGMKKFETNIIPSEQIENGIKFKEMIQTAYIPKVSIHFLNEDVGHGLFAQEALSIGVYVGEYTGTVRENDRRYLEPLNNYCYEYPVPDEDGINYVIDATHGNLTRFINHSYQPNLKPMYAFIDGFYHLIFLSIKSINKGEQLVYNYGNNYWYLRGKPAELKANS